MDNPNATDADFHMPFKLKEIRRLFKCFAVGDHSRANNSVLPAAVKNKLGLNDKAKQVLGEVRQYAISNMVATHGRFVGENFYIYRQQCIERCMRLKNKKDRSPVVNAIIRVMKKSSRPAASKRNVLKEFDRYKLKAHKHAETCVHVNSAIYVYFPFRKYATSNAAKLRKLRDLRMVANSNNETHNVLFQLVPLYPLKRAFIELSDKNVCDLHCSTLGMHHSPRGMSRKDAGVSVFDRLFGFFEDRTYRVPREGKQNDKRY